VAHGIAPEEGAVIAGHFGLAAAVKWRAPAAPLWLLMIATQWLDIVFVPLFVLGVERLVPLPGAKSGAYGQALIYADYTHSLFGALLLSALLGAVASLRYGSKNGFVVGLVSFSHWVLDLLVHRGDLPILPGNLGRLPRLGFGLWRFTWLSALFELALVFSGALLYWRAARATIGHGRTDVRRADFCAAALLTAGMITLGMNLAGL